MHALQMAIAVMAADDSQWGPRDAEGRRRTYTDEELAALVAFRWPWDGVKGRLAAGVNAVRSLVGPRMKTRMQPTVLPSTDATAQA